MGSEILGLQRTATIQKREQGSYKDAGVIGQQHKQRWKNNLKQASTKQLLDEQKKVQDTKHLKDFAPSILPKFCLIKIKPIYISID